MWSAGRKTGSEARIGRSRTGRRIVGIECAEPASEADAFDTYAVDGWMQAVEGSSLQRGTQLRVRDS